MELYAQMDDPGYEKTLDARVLQMQWLLEQAIRLRPRATSMLDIGAGAGLLVREGYARGIRAVGVELSMPLVRLGKERFEVELLQGVFPHPKLAGQKFDVVFLVDVLEHVTNPIILLTDCRNALSPEGVLLVVTPDVRSFAARILGRKWWHFRLAHVGYFSRKNLTVAADLAALRPVKWFRACWFFPVGYVAERLSQYLPISWFNRLMGKMPLTRWIYKRRVRLNLFDSWAVAFTPASTDR
jgi:SAM-dependent methyltransferase